MLLSKLRVLVIVESHSDFDFIEKLLSQSPRCQYSVKKHDRLLQRDNHTNFLPVDWTQFDLCLLDESLLATSDSNLPGDIGAGEFGTPVIVLSESRDARRSTIAHGSCTFDVLQKNALTTGSLESSIWYALACSQAPAQLHRNEEKFRGLVEQTEGVVGICRSDRTLIYLSPSSKRILGCELSECEAPVFDAFIMPEDHAQLLEAFEQMLTEPGMRSRAVLHRSQRSEVQTLECQFTNMLHDSAIEGVVVNIRDISEQNKATRALRESQELFLKSFWGSPLAIIISKLDSATILDVNPGFEAITKFRREEAIGASGGGLGLWPKPQERAYMHEQMNLHKHLHNYEFSFRRADGSIGRALGSFELVEIGGDAAVVTIAYDISERAAFQEELRFQARALAQINEAVIAVDNDGVVTYWNDGATRLFHFTAEEVIGREALSFLNYRLAGSTNEAVRPTAALTAELQERAAPNTGHWQGEFTHTLRDGSTITVASSITTLFDEAGVKQGLLTVTRDITEQNAKEAQLDFQASALSQATDAVVALDTRGRITYWNVAAENLYGIKSSEAIGAVAAALYQSRWPNEGDGERAEALLSTAGRWEGEHIYTRPDGTERYLSSSVSVLRDRANNPVRRLAITRDITEQRRTSLALQRSELHYRVIFEDNPMPMWVMERTAFRILEVNEAAIEHYGYSRDEFLSMTVLELRPADDHQVFLNYVRSQESSEDAFGVWRHLKKNGEIIHVSVVSHEIIIDGMAARIVLLNDVTRRRQIEQDLRDANERFNLAAQAVSAVIYDWDLLSDTTAHTEGLMRLLGYDAPPIAATLPRGHHRAAEWWTEQVHASDREIMRTVINDALRSESNFELEYRMIHKDGHYIYVWDRGLVVRDASGKAVRVVGSAQDITERKRMEAQLAHERALALAAKDSAEEMSRLKTSFLANMSHEIRTPMTAILGFASVLRESLVTKELKKYAEVIESSGQRLLATINGILDLAKVEANKLDVSLRPTLLNEELERTIMLLRPLAEMKRINLNLEIPKTPVHAITDPHCFSQIVTNIFGNAVKFTDKGTITVSLCHGEHPELTTNTSNQSFWAAGSIPGPATPRDRYYSIMIKDTGIGISEEFLPKIFDEFKQESTGYQRKYEGTGLGLTIAQRLTEALGGSIEVISQTGVGSMFVMRFLYQQTPELHSLQAGSVLHADLEPRVMLPTAEADDTSALPHILLVEDTLDAVPMIQLFLGGVCSVDHAPDATVGLSMILKRRYDLILMDVNLGEGLSGLDLTRFIRQQLEHQTLPIVALTAYAMRGDREEALSAGCNDYLSKPFSRPELIEVVTRHVRKVPNSAVSL